MRRRDAHARSTALVAVLCAFSATHTEFVRASSDSIARSKAQCANALATNDPPCAHGTIAATVSSPHPENCASCAIDGDVERGCPNGWRGAKCDVCEQRATCDARRVDGAIRRASACTSRCWTPTAEELRPIGEVGAAPVGKVFSCACGGDAQTDAYCKYQANTTIEMRVIESGFGGRAKYAVMAREYAGMPRQDQAPDHPDKYKYAAPAAGTQISRSVR
jgi:hypothetical protein